MNVESIQTTTQGLKTKNSKTDKVKDGFSEIYDQSINRKEKKWGKIKDADRNLSEKSNMDKKNTNGSEETSKSDEERKVETVNPIGVFVNMTINNNEQVNLSSFELAKLIQPEENSLLIRKMDNSTNTIEEEAKLNTLTSMANSKEVALSQKNVQEINNILYKLMEATSNNESSVMEVQLDPTELGRIDVTRKMEDGKWITKILVDNDHVKQMVTNEINVDVEDVQVEVKANSTVPKRSSLSINSVGATFVKEQTNIDTTFMVNKIQREEVSIGKILNDITEAPQDPKEASSTIEKQDVNFNVREFASKQISTVGIAKELDLPDENLQKVNDSIVKLMETTTQGNTSVMKVRLYPEELGSVDVTLKMEDGKLIAKIMVDNEQIKQLFTNKINELSNNLIKQNINIDKIHIDVNSSANFNGGSNQNKGSYYKKNHRSPFDTEAADSMTAEDKAEKSGAISILA